MDWITSLPQSPSTDVAASPGTTSSHPKVEQAKVYGYRSKLLYKTSASFSLEEEGRFGWGHMVMTAWLTVGSAAHLQVSVQTWAPTSLPDTKYAPNSQKCWYHVHTEAGARWTACLPLEVLRQCIRLWLKGRCDDRGGLASIILLPNNNANVSVLILRMSW